MSTELNARTPEKAMPATIIMERDAFFRWLSETQGIADPNVACDDPDFLIEEMTGSDSPYFQVAAYLNTAEGTVIARHFKHSNMVKVTICKTKPDTQLMRTVRWMLDEESEAA